MVKSKGYYLYFTKLGRDRLDNLGIDEYKVKNIIESYWNSKKLEKKRQNKYFITFWHKERYIKMRFRLYDDEKRLLIIMAETFKKMRK
jgi:uncharacterized ubiquitin-like protein YukD